MNMSESELLDDLRPRTFAIAYRMLGTVSEAEDVVQEALLRVHNAIESGEQISSPRAYAATVATRQGMPARCGSSMIGSGVSSRGACPTTC